jgi:hypothetical protein
LWVTGDEPQVNMRPFGRRSDQHFGAQNGSTHQPPGYHFPSMPHQLIVQTPLAQLAVHIAGAMQVAGLALGFAAWEMLDIPATMNDATVAASTHLATIFSM